MLNLIPKIKNTDSGNFLLICGPGNWGNDAEYL